jgi:hypothetical protein
MRRFDPALPFFWHIRANGIGGPMDSARAGQRRLSPKLR